MASCELLLYESEVSGGGFDSRGSLFWSKAAAAMKTTSVDPKSHNSLVSWLGRMIANLHVESTWPTERGGGRVPRYVHTVYYPDQASATLTFNVTFVAGSPPMCVCVPSPFSRRVRRRFPARATPVVAHTACSCFTCLCCVCCRAASGRCVPRRDIARCR
jgi:hypothetical protein